MTAVLPIPSAGVAEPASRSVRTPAEFNVAAHGLRGLASLMVLGAHIIGGTARHIYPHDLDYVRAVERPWHLGGYGVELFFVISGFVILPSALKYSAGNFALRRLLRLYPLFLVLSLLFIVLNAITDAYPKTNNIESIVAGLLFINLFTDTEQLTPNAWSLSFEVVFYVLTAAAVHFVVKRPNLLLAGATAIAGVAFLIAFPITIYFLLGIAIRLFGERATPPPAVARWLEPLFLLIALGLASHAHYEYRLADFADPVVVPMIAFTGLYFWLAVRPDSLTSRALDNRPCAYVGTVSYSLYLVHPYVYFSVRTLFERLGWFTADVAQSMLFFALVVVGLSFAATHLAHVALERWPYQSFFRQRIYRAPSGEPRQRRPRSDDVGNGEQID